MSEETRQDYLYDEIRSLKESVSGASDKLNHLDKTVAEYKIVFDHHSESDALMYDELKRMNNILAENTNSLKYHIKRTNALEELAVGMNTRLSELEIRNIQINAVKDWKRSRMMLAAKIVGASTGISAVIGTVYALLPSIAKWLVALAN